LLISTVIFIDGEERQFPAESVSIGAPLGHLVRVDLADKGEIIIPMSAIKEIHTRELPADAITADIFN
jgi:hypothetical protein